jgi:hypothetical protein
MTAPTPLRRLPYVLLGAMTFVSFVGPFVLLVALRGGASAKWPPDRPLEWVVVIAVFGLVIGLFLACVSIGWWYRRTYPARDPGSGIAIQDKPIKLLPVNQKLTGQ